MVDDELLLQVGLAQDWAELQALTVKAAHQLGFGMASGVRIIGRLSSGKATVQSFGNPPEGFVEASKSLDLSLRDPVLGTLLSRPGFVRYDKDFYAQAGAGDLSDLLEPWGYRYGLGFSMHDQGEVFSFGLDTPDRLPSDGHALIERKAMLQLLTLHAHMAARQIASPTVVTHELTPVEKELLRWEAQGSIWRAGEVLSLADVQVASHAGSAARKMGATSVRGAALVAIRGGLIEP